MNSILTEIKKLRPQKPWILDRQNSNRYRVVLQEPDSSKTAYCFSVPIYNQTSQKLVDLRFHRNQNFFRTIGSNAYITVSEQNVLFESHGSICEISLPGTITSHTDQTLRCGLAEISPTLNGLLFKVPCPPKGNHTITLLSSIPFPKLRDNTKSFSLMSDDFKPFITISCIGTLNSTDRIIAPADITFQKNTDQAFTLTIHPHSPYGRYVLYEINLHESKLLQDTTVESLHPTDNNAFGGTSYLGSSAAYGEQWLYTKPDLSLLPDLAHRHIKTATLHIPKLTDTPLPLTAHRLTTRFCSFGSNWNNKLSATEELSSPLADQNYYHLALTPWLTDKATHRLIHTDGFILKATHKNSGFAAVSTGDSYYAPQILEIRYFSV